MKAGTINQKILKNKNKNVNKKKVIQPTNHILLLVDTSGSMLPHLININKYLDTQLTNINKVSNEHKQKTVIHCKAFSNDRAYTSLLLVDANIHATSGSIISSDNKFGWNGTPLLAAIKESNEFLNKMMGPTDTAMLLVITDGFENASRMTDVHLASSIHSSKNFDRITYAAAGPKESQAFFSNNTLGPIFADNFVSWDTSDKGFVNITTSTNNAVGNYYGGVSRGLIKMQKVFIDMSTVNKKDLKSLRSIPYNFESWKVDSEQRIDDFINNKLTMPTNKRIFGNNTYQIGRAFYQLSKPEKVQAEKVLIIKDKKTNKYYYGNNDIKNILGLPSNQSVKIEPENLSSYEIYVQSTSTNRKLVRGTNIIYVNS